MTHDEIWNSDFTVGHRARARDYAMQQVEKFIDRQLELRQGAESPLEASFVAWYAALSVIGLTEFRLAPQVPVKVPGSAYRIDFMVEPPEAYRHLRQIAERLHLVFPKFAIELDGHDFHERTKPQVIKRDSRDRDLIAAGWQVMHFSGSEFNSDPVACVLSIGKTISDAMLDLEERVYNAEQSRE